MNSEWDLFFYHNYIPGLVGWDLFPLVPLRFPKFPSTAPAASFSGIPDFEISSVKSNANPILIPVYFRIFETSSPTNRGKLLRSVVSLVEATGLASASEEPLAASDLGGISGAMTLVPEKRLYLLSCLTAHLATP